MGIWKKKLTSVNYCIIQDKHCAPFNYENMRVGHFLDVLNTTIV